MRRLLTTLAVVLLPAILHVDPSGADEIVFLNGDRLSGKIITAAAGKLTITTEIAGEVTVDLAQVKTFSTDEAVQVGVGKETAVSSRVTAGAPRQVQTEPAPGAAPQPLAIADIRVINPIPPAWTGSFAVNGLATTGNSETEQFGFNAELSKRWEHDRLTLGAQYSFGRQGDPDSDDEVTTVDYGMALAKYDHFFTERLYLYGLVKAERDGVAELEVRLSPGAGVGYQWFEGPTFNLSTEAGLVWVYEDFKRSGSRTSFGPRLAYSVDWTPIHRLKLFHKLEYLPAFDDLAGDYLINADAGARLTVWKELFAELRYEFRYDSTPARGRKNADSRYILGAGWAF
ncbi:MAG: DUF481 domain-containing protein [Candidatus Rokuibacteriota bacterium]